MDEYQADKMIALLEQIQQELRDANSTLREIAATNKTLSDDWAHWERQNYPVATVESG